MRLFCADYLECQRKPRPTAAPPTADNKNQKGSGRISKTDSGQPGGIGKNQLRQVLGTGKNDITAKI
jgi:hypothetical protein